MELERNSEKGSAVDECYFWSEDDWEAVHSHGSVLLGEVLLKSLNWTVGELLKIRN